MKLELQALQGPDRGRIFVMNVPGRYSFGKADSCTFQLADSTAHFFQFSIELRGQSREAYFLNKFALGTAINSQPLLEKQLVSGDRISFGENLFQIDVRSEDAIPIVPLACSQCRHSYGAGNRTLQCIACGAPLIPEEDLPSEEPAAGKKPPPGAPAEAVPPPKKKREWTWNLESLFESDANELIADRFSIRQDLGAGSFGAAWLCWDLKTKKKVVVKVLQPAALWDSRGVESAINEIKALDLVQSPHVVRFIHAGETNDGLPFIAMEYAPGVTLASLVGMLDEPTICELGAQLCEGLAALHTARVTHRDIKPDNIIAVCQGKDTLLKIIDLGVAGIRQGSTALLNKHRLAQADLPGAVFGTLAYMAPEYAGGLPADARSDLYSAGVTLFELISSQLPVAGPRPTDYESLHAYLAARKRLIREVAPGVSAGLAAVIDRALATDPALRFGNATAMAEALRAAARPQIPPTAPAIGLPLPQTPPPPPKARWPVVALSCLSIAAAAIAALEWRKRTHLEESGDPVSLRVERDRMQSALSVCRTDLADAKQLGCKPAEARLAVCEKKVTNADDLLLTTRAQAEVAMKSCQRQHVECMTKLSSCLLPRPNSDQIEVVK